MGIRHNTPCYKKYTIGFVFFIHNIPKQLHDGLFSKKEIAIKNNCDNLQLLVEKFTIYDLSAFRKWGLS